MNEVVLNSDFLAKLLESQKFVTKKQMQSCDFPQYWIDDIVSDYSKQITDAYYTLRQAAHHHETMIRHQREADMDVDRLKKVYTKLLIKLESAVDKPVTDSYAGVVNLVKAIAVLSDKIALLEVK